MKSDKTDQTRAELLRELENLRAQLAATDEGDEDQDQIPLLIDKVENAMSDAAAGNRNRARKAQKKSATSGATPGRLSSEATSPPKGRGDNPFLPQHIRDRLEERRQALADDIAQASSFFPAKPDRPRTAAPKLDLLPGEQSLVDDLVAEYLPRIETELRRRLARQFKDIVAAARTEGSSKSDKSP